MSVPESKCLHPLIKASEAAKVWGHAWVRGEGEKGDKIQAARPSHMQGVGSWVLSPPPENGVLAG